MSLAYNPRHDPNISKLDLKIPNTETVLAYFDCLLFSRLYEDCVSREPNSISSLIYPNSRVEYVSDPSPDTLELQQRK